MKINGTVRRNNIEGGIWTLVADNGEVFQLNNETASKLKDGEKITATGEVDTDMMGFGMVGPMFNLKQCSKK